MEDSLDENNELPEKFLHEIYKWALECKYVGKRLMGKWTDATITKKNNLIRGVTTN